VVSPLSSALPRTFTLSGAYEALGISPVATGDQRYTTLDSCRLLKKAGENFYKNSRPKLVGAMFRFAQLQVFFENIAVRQVCSSESRSLHKEKSNTTIKLCCFLLVTFLSTKEK